MRLHWDSIDYGPGGEVQLLHYHTVTFRHLYQLNLVQENIFTDRLMRLHGNFIGCGPSDEVQLLYHHRSLNKLDLAKEHI